MAVVVNEMEVVPAAPEAAGLGEGPRTQSEGRPLDPREVERAVMKELERWSRVRAH
ncbi:MAG TPA: hypothetical protein VN937_05900 [Blastocatellia bacterium]|nr:hypothetical protein [Blastocatellia bacterium]